MASKVVQRGRIQHAIQVRETSLACVWAKPQYHITLVLSNLNAFEIQLPANMALALLVSMGRMGQGIVPAHCYQVNPWEQEYAATQRYDYNEAALVIQAGDSRLHVPLAAPLRLRMLLHLRTPNLVLERRDMCALSAALQVDERERCIMARVTVRAAACGKAASDGAEAHERHGSGQAASERAGDVKNVSVDLACALHATTLQMRCMVAHGVRSLRSGEFSRTQTHSGSGVSRPNHA